MERKLGLFNWVAVLQIPGIDEKLEAALGRLSADEFRVLCKTFRFPATASAEEIAGELMKSAREVRTLQQSALVTLRNAM